MILCEKLINFPCKTVLNYILEETILYIQNRPSFKFRSSLVCLLISYFIIVQSFPQDHIP